MKKQKRSVDVDLDSYESSSDSNEEYDDNEKYMLQQAAKRRSKTQEDDESEAEVFGIHDSDDEEENLYEPLGQEMDSDIEGKVEDELPEPRGWGFRNSVYYQSDMDKDYGGFTNAEDEEDALNEEKEGKSNNNIETSEFVTKVYNSRELENEDAANVFEQVIETDRINKREKDFFDLEGLVSHFKEKMSYAQDHLEPILKLVKSGVIPECPAMTLIATKYITILNFCTNIACYLLLKSKNMTMNHHPIIKKLIEYYKLMEEMEPVDEELIHPQVLEILELKKKGIDLKILEFASPSLSVITGNRAKRRQIMKELRVQEAKKPRIDSFEEMQIQDNIDHSFTEDTDVKDESEKRGITFEIAKNKGLTPKRKKENRNPRVKHRNKFRKASIRRKGQVQIPYKEKMADGTVPFGIKLSVVKSIKLK